MVSDQEYPKVHTILKACLAFIKQNETLLIKGRHAFILKALCLWSQASPWGIHLAALNGDVVSDFTIIC